MLQRLKNWIDRFLDRGAPWAPPATVRLPAPVFHPELSAALDGPTPPQYLGYDVLNVPPPEGGVLQKTDRAWEEMPLGKPRAKKRKAKKKAGGIGYTGARYSKPKLKRTPR